MTKDGTNKQESFIAIQHALIDEGIINSDQLFDEIKNFNIFSDREFFLHFINSIFNCVAIRPKRTNFYLSVIFSIRDQIFQQFPLINCYHHPILSKFFDEMRLHKAYDENRQYLFLGIETHQELLQFIIDDNLGEFQDFLSKTNTDINLTIQVDTLFIYQSMASLLELASLFGSVRIFKFLLLREATITSSLPYFVLAGGNYELIHICESQNIQLTAIDAVSYAIQYWHNDIVEYLAPSSFDVLPISAKYYNLELLFKSVKEVPKNMKSRYLYYNDFRLACFYASERAYLESVRILCDIEPLIVEKCDYYNNYMIHYATKTNILDVIRFICNLPYSDLNVNDGFTFTPLFIAVNQGYLDAIDLLCSYSKVDLNHQDYHGNTALFYAIKQGSIDSVRIFMKYCSRLISDIRNNEGLTYLHAAIQSKSLEIVKLIYEFDNDLCLIGNKTNSTVLTYSIAYGTPEIVNFFGHISKIDVNATNKNGIAALHLAVRDIDKLKILWNIPNIDLNIPNDRGIYLLFYFYNTPLHLAASNGFIDSVSFLLQFESVNYNAINNYGNSPIFAAAENKQLSIVNLLLQQKDIEINNVNKAGILILLDFFYETLLHQAVKSDEINIVRSVIEKTPDLIHIKSNSGLEPIEMTQNTEIIQFLQSKS